jgi:hypothetical protein
MTTLQKDRIYSLIVGDSQDAIEINGLQIKFKAYKTSNNKDKKNTAFVEIYNLSPERRAKLEQEYVQVSLSVGWAGGELVNLFQGEVKNVTTSKLDSFLTKRQGTDLVTRLELDELYTQINGKAFSSFVPAGSTIGQVVQRLTATTPEISRVVLNGETVNKMLPDGYPISGTIRQVLDRLSRDYDVEWQIDGGILYVIDSNGTISNEINSVPSVGIFSGLLDRPEYINEEAKRLRKTIPGKPRNSKKAPKQNAVKFKILLNPSIVAGSIVYLDFEPISGYYKVDEVTHEGDYRGNPWWSTLICTEKIS